MHQLSEIAFYPGNPERCVQSSNVCIDCLRPRRFLIVLVVESPPPGPRVLRLALVWPRRAHASELQLPAVAFAAEPMGWELLPARIGLPIAPASR